MNPRFRHNCRRSWQRGISVFVVMTMVLLGTLFVLWGSRTALLNEMLAGNDSDYQRALEAAHALVRDAEFDIQGENVDGTPCAERTNCRPWGVIDAGAGKAFYPTDLNELRDLEAILAAKTGPSCIAGICTRVNVPVLFWESTTSLDAMKAVAATYGAYTDAKTGRASSPLLAKDKAWYWVEVLPYNMGAQTDGGAARELAPDRSTPYIYRITAVVRGLKPATQAVIQATMVWKKVGS
jgi:type IV pilus assembly protein PilX